MEFDIKIYETSLGQSPFDLWLESIRDTKTTAKILIRLDRLKLGNFCDCKSLGDGKRIFKRLFI